MEAYDEFALLAENAQEAGLEFEAPMLRRVTTTAPSGLELSGLAWGDGPPEAVLIHGGAQNAHTWDTVALALDRPLLAVDLPGHGGSSKDVGTGSIEELAGAVRGLLDALGIDSRHLVGHSLGGAVCAQLAIDDAARARSLVLIAPAGFGDEINGEYLAGFVAARSRRELMPVLGLLFADPALVTRQMAEEVLRYKRLDGVDTALGAISAAVFPDGTQAIDLASGLTDSAVPLLARHLGRRRPHPAGSAGEERAVDGVGDRVAPPGPLAAHGGRERGEPRHRRVRRGQLVSGGLPWPAGAGQGPDQAIGQISALRPAKSHTRPNARTRPLVAWASRVFASFSCGCRYWGM